MFTVGQQHVIDYPTPITLTWSWSWGSLAGLFLVVQIVSGCFLAMHYDAGRPYDSTMAIINEVPGGMWTRMAHQNGASMYFYALYVHMWRTFRYGSYVEPRQRLWDLGMTVYLISMAVAFLGYVLPWGQMSFWGATVITQLLSIVPYVGQDLVHWLWGGYYVGRPTLNRFYSMHYMAPMVILGLIVAHICALHKDGSSNPLGLPAIAASLKFVHKYGWKDMVGFIAVWVPYIAVMTYYPSFFGFTSHPDNYVEANPLATPHHIVPEWYFLWIYAILRSIPSKLGGLIMVAAIIFALYCLPRFEGHPFFALIGLVCFYVLTWVGLQPMTKTVMLIGQWTTVIFVCWILVVQLLAVHEQNRRLRKQQQQSSSSPPRPYPY